MKHNSPSLTGLILHAQYNNLNKVYNKCTISIIMYYKYNNHNKYNKHRHVASLRLGGWAKPLLTNLQPPEPAQKVHSMGILVGKFRKCLPAAGCFYHFS